MRTPAMPRFLNISDRSRASFSTDLDGHLDAYRVLLGIWLIDMSFSLRWIDRPPSGSVVQFFAREEFIETTGLPELNALLRPPEGDDDEVEEDGEPEDCLMDFDDVPTLRLQPRRRKAMPSPRKPGHKRHKLAQLLKHRRAELVKQGVRTDLPLFQNIERIGRLVNLTDVEKAVLTFAACTSCFSSFQNTFASHSTPTTDQGLISLLAALTGHSPDLVRKAIRDDSALVSSGLVRVDHEEADLDSKITLGREMQGMMLDTLTSDDELGNRVLRKSKPGTLTLADFPHLVADAQLISDYLAGACQTQANGVNVLLYGPPGTGKTEFAKALAATCGLNLFDVNHADADGDPLSATERLSSLNLCQRVLKDKPRSALLFDEIEDVFHTQPSGSFMSMLLALRRSNSNAKAWFNRKLEDNLVPTIWITNDTSIDPAYLRRFDYSVAMRIPPRQVRLRITTDHLGPHAPSPTALVPIAELDDLVPAQLERAARVARLCALTKPELAWQYSQQTLQRSRALLGQTRKNLRATPHTQYNLALLNTDANIPDLLSALRVRPHACVCLYGPPGTGKSQLSRFIADELGKPLLVKRGSDLLDKYVGGTEKLIATMFEQALDEDAVLLLDEADSFLTTRSGAAQHWEVTQTNEMLTQLECFDGIFMATTNLMAQFEPASLRRFSHKISFDYLKPEQRWEMFIQEFSHMGGDADEAYAVAIQVKQMEGLAPGDFAVIGKRRVGLTEGLTAVEYLRLLQQEVGVKLHGKGRVGFV